MKQGSLNLMDNKFEQLTPRLMKIDDLLVEEKKCPKFKDYFDLWDATEERE
jgi:hypothetical protein